MMFNNILRKITIVSASVIAGLTISSCSPEVNQSIITSEDSLSVSENSTDEKQIASVVVDFFNFTITPLKENPDFSDVLMVERIPNIEEKLKIYDSLYDLNEYINYDDLTSVQKIEVNRMVIANKNSADNSNDASYAVSTDKIKVEEDRANVNGEGIILRVDTSTSQRVPGNNSRETIIEQNAGSDYDLEVIKTPNGWKIDGESLIPEENIQQELKST